MTTVLVIIADECLNLYILLCIRRNKI